MSKQNQVNVRSVAPCLVFKERAEEAVTFYVSLFKDSGVVQLVRSEGGPIPAGRLLHATFSLCGQQYTAFDGGDHFAFSEAFSLVATCETQQELDEVWARLTADGGKEGPCGWLTDKFGVSWQVVPRVLGDMMTNTKDGDPAKVMQALLKMSKLDIKALEKAYRS